MSEVKPVSIGRKARKLSGFAWNVLNYVQQKRGNTVFASREVYSKRVAICNSCDKFIEKKNECGECGCFIPAKANIALNSCPLNRWEDSPVNKVIEDPWEDSPVDKVSV